MNLFGLIDMVFSIYTILLSINILSSWFPDFASMEWMRYVYRWTEPYLAIFRKIIPPLGFIDISPIVAFFALQYAQVLIKKIILLLLVNMV